MSNVPTVMVSSTFYDLRQLRTDLRQFIETELGYRSLLSEYASFPVDPDLDTIENCRRRVEQDANILVLVIGGRYGSVDSSTSKSITNLEYLVAYNKGIPVYAFVEKRIQSLLPIWKKNKEADYSGVVDDVRLFDFIEKVSSIDRVWTLGFETAQEIITALRMQFAHLMNEGLQWRLQLRRPGQEDALRGLTGRALRIALEKPQAWEYRLFAQVLTDEIASHKDLRRQHKLGIAIGPGEQLSNDQVPDWFVASSDELLQSLAAFNTLMNTALREAFGPPDLPGDIEYIAFVGRQLGHLYRHAIEWSLSIRRVHADPLWMPVLSAQAAFTDDIIKEIEGFGPSLAAKVEEALAEVHANPDTPIKIEATLTLRASNMERILEEIERIQQTL